MRFAILSNSFPPDGRGGAEQIAFLQADALACLGHDVRVWVPKKAEAGREVIHGMEVMRFPSRFAELGKMSPLARLRFHLLEDSQVRQDIADAITTWKPDVLLTHNLTGCGMATPKVIQSRGVKWIHTLHDIQLTDPSGLETVARSKSALVGAWRGFWSSRRRATFGTPTVLVSPTQWLLDWHHRHGFHGATTAVIPNPVETDEKRERVLRSPATVAFVGRLSRDKGFEVFLDIITRLDAALVSKIVVVGDGPILKHPLRLQDARLDLRGALPPDQAHRVIADADLLIAPSQVLENQQTILLEAMAEGTPAIATDTGGTRETLEGTGCPIISTTGDQAATFAKTITALLSDPKQWSLISHAMQEHAKRHDRENYFDALFNIISART